MDKYPKFIIEDGALILSKVRYHKEIAIDKTKVTGGGWFRFNQETNSFIFYGQSEDFGPASMENIKKAILENKVFTNNHQTHNISDKHNFYYDIGSELIPLKIIEKTA